MPRHEGAIPPAGQWCRSVTQSVILALSQWLHRGDRLLSSFAGMRPLPSGRNQLRCSDDYRRSALESGQVVTRTVLIHAGGGYGDSRGISHSRGHRHLLKIASAGRHAVEIEGSLVLIHLLSLTADTAPRAQSRLPR
jgi:hypothetical protein